MAAPAKDCVNQDITLESKGNNGLDTVGQAESKPEGYDC